MKKRLWFVYTIGILLLTLAFRRPTLVADIKLIPFWSWFISVTKPDIKLGVQIILNILLFYGWAKLSDLKPRDTFLLACLFSLGIECIQGTFHLGTMDVDDLIGNGLGAYLGSRRRI